MALWRSLHVRLRRRPASLRDEAPGHDRYQLRWELIEGYRLIPVPERSFPKHGPVLGDIWGAPQASLCLPPHLSLQVRGPLSSSLVVQSWL